MGRLTTLRTVVVATLVAALAGVLAVSALATDGRNASNTHTIGGIYHGIYTEHKGSGGNGWYFHVWTEHGHGGNKIVELAHYPNTHIHCAAGPGTGGTDGHLHCSKYKISKYHQSAHDAPYDTYPGECRKYGDGHGICFHWHNGPFL